MFEGVGDGEVVVGFLVGDLFDEGDKVVFMLMVVEG